MRDVIVLEDDEEEMVSASQVQRGLSEAQKSRMMQQKQLALARLQAKRVQQTPVPFCESGGLQRFENFASVEMRSRAVGGDLNEMAGTSAGSEWGPGPRADEWQHSRVPDQGYQQYSSSSGPFYHGSHPSSGNADGRYADGFVNRGSYSSSTCGLESWKDGSRRVVPNGNQGCWDADFDQGSQGVSRPLDSRQNSAHVPAEEVGEWRSVRKRPAPGSSFGRQISASSNQSKPPSASEYWQIFKSPKTSPDASRPVKQSPGYSPLKFRGFQEPDLQQPAGQRRDQPNMNNYTAPPERKTRIEEPGNTLPTTKEKPKPSPQQMEVLKAIAQRKSVFVTGSAGTGKSFIVEDALQILRGMYGDDKVFVTASTGLAACAVGGTTLHSFAGVGIGVNETKEQLADKVLKKREVRARWAKAKALIIDEISMIDGELFDKLEYIARRVKGRAKGPDEVWGGLQLIVTGDFFQLEPVKPSNPQKYFAFQADCWDESFDVQVELSHVFRQSDMKFVNMLNEIRRGVCSPSTLHRLRQCQGPSEGASNGIEMTRLYPHQMDVRRENDQNLRSIGGDMIVYKAKDEAHNEFGLRQLENVRAAAVQPLCVGAQVILLKNLETGVGLVNGARGVVVRFSAPDDPAAAEHQKLARFINPVGQWPIVRFACDGFERLVGPESWSVLDGDKEIAKRSQIPLMLGWALSVHKCQGMTLDRVETNLSKAFGHGMVYVALSRVKSLQGLRLIGFDPSRIKTLPVVARFYEGLNKKSEIDLDDDDFS
ncbi:hypothetical protein M758_3G002100 [Ceratodon purpureus]|nr:hypothetical protein M758_3G002100 [Ceratodon purpureus]